MSGQDRTEPAIASRLGDERERRASQQNRIARRVVLVAGDDHRPRRICRLIEHGPDDCCGNRGLVAENDQRPGRRARNRLKPDGDGAGQPARRFRVGHPALSPPVDRGLDRLGVVAEHDDDVGQAGDMQRVQHVLKDRPATERGQQLDAPEARGRPRGEDDRGDPLRRGRLGHPPVIGVGSRITRT
jgi:hypothetical protein